MSSNIAFNTTFNDPQNQFSSFYAAIQSHIKAAGSYWGNYLEGNASLEVIVNFSNSIPRATGGSVTSSFARNNGTFKVYEQGAAAEIRTGNDPNGIDPDIQINFNPDYLTNELWFDDSPLTRISSIPNNKTDAVSVIIHELGHALAFSGWRNDLDGTLPGNYESTFDEKTIFDGSNFFFVGSQATSLYGSSVPLTYGNITHVGNDLPRPGSDLIPDLMNGVVYNRGYRYNISPLDIAILADSGLPIVSTQPIIGLTINPSSVLEDGTSNLIYTFTRTGVLTLPLTVNYSLTGTATNGVDYGNIGTSVTFAANSATATVTVNPTADTTVESNETVSLTLASNAAYTIGTTGAVTGTITNDDVVTNANVTLALDYSGISENSPTNFTYTLTRTGSLTNSLVVNFNVIGTATLSTDYIQTGATNFSSTTGKVTFAANLATARVVINPTEDTIVEPNETLALQLKSGTGYTIGTASAVTATIINDDGTRRQIATNGNDVILGRNKNDVIIGGLGNDTLTGSGNADLFTFQGSNEGIDRITDFTPDDDLIVVSASGFAGGLTAADVLKSNQFFIGTSATTTTHRIIYNNGTGALLFDKDGTGATAAIQFATLNTGLALTNEDIFVS